MNETHLVLRSIQSLIGQSRPELRAELYAHVLRFVIVTVRLHLTHTLRAIDQVQVGSRGF